MTVIAIIALLAAVVSPAIQSISSASTLSKSSSDIASALEQARAYAMGNNTYVYVGFQEVSSPQAPASNVGRIEVAIVASQDGTRPYQNSPGPLSGAQLVAVSRLNYLDNLHMASSSSLTSGNMVSRPPTTTTGFIDISQSASAVTFPWPLTGTTQSTFSQVIEIDPQGVARVQTETTYSPTIPSYIEIGLLPTHGDIVSNTGGNEAAIQVDGITGAVTTYRP
jgi:Tfp pilus assembly protein FimT